MVTAKLNMGEQTFRDGKRRKYKCRSCKREWDTTWIDSNCQYCGSAKVHEFTRKK